MRRRSGALGASPAAYRAALNLAAIVLLALMTLGLGAGSSAAAPSGIPSGIAAAIPTGTDCLHPPDPESPTDGISNFIDSGPAVPVKGDPFKKAPAGQPQPTLYDTYGYAGLTGTAFDDGCDPRWNPFQLLANAVFAGACVTIAFAVWLYRTVMSGVIGDLLDPVQTALQQGWGVGLLLPLLGIAMTVTGLYFIWKARDADVAEASTKSAVSAVIIAAGVVATLYPLLVGATVDRAVDEGMGAVASIVSQSDERTDPGDAVALNLHETILYRAWQQGTFGTGDLNQKVADEYGPRLFAAKAFTRDEAAYLTAHPDKAEELADRKREAYKTAALEIQEKYPTVYPYVAGNKSDSWFGFALLALLSALVGTVFLVVALVKIAYALIALRFTIGVTPGVALVSQHPKLHHLAVGLGSVIWDALMKAAYYGVSVIIFVIAGIGGILDPALQWSPLVKIAVLALATYAGWMFAKRLGLANDLARLRFMARNAKERGSSLRDRLLREGGDGSRAHRSSEDLYSPPTTGHDPYREATPAESRTPARFEPVLVAGRVPAAELAGSGVRGAAAAAMVRAPGTPATTPRRAVDPSAIYHPARDHDLLGEPVSAAASTFVNGRPVYSVYTPTTPGDGTTPSTVREPVAAGAGGGR